jgi:sulfonate transport system substrate-binding protein
MFKNRRWRRQSSLVAALTTVALLAAACSGSDGDSSTSTTLRYGYVGVDTQLPPDEVGWGLKQGLAQKIFANHGIEAVETIPFLTGPDLNEAVLGGRIDATLTGDTPALTARGSGGPTRLLAIPGEITSVLIAKDGGPQSISDFSGKKIAVVKGSTMHRFLVSVLDRNNVEAEIININGLPDSLAALNRGEVDGLATVSYAPPVDAALKNGFNVVTSSTDYDDVASLRVSTVTDSFLDGHGGFADAWAEMRSAALADIQANPQPYYDWLAESTGTPREDVERIYPLGNYSEESLRPDLVTQLEGTKEFLVDQKLIRNDFDLQQWTAN